jgi:ATP-binding cassette, subfamily B, multidrug efflux pump
VLTEENIGRIRLVRASVRERYVIMRFRSEADSMVAAASRAVRLEAFCTPFLLQLPTAGLIAVLLYGSHRALGGGISIGESATFHIYVLLLVEPAGRIAYWMVVVQAAIRAPVASTRSSDTRPSPSAANRSRLRPSRSRCSMPRSGIRMLATPSRAST